MKTHDDFIKEAVSIAKGGHPDLYGYFDALFLEYKKENQQQIEEIVIMLLQKKTIEDVEKCIKDYMIEP